MNERRKLTMDRERNESIAGISTLSIESDRSTRGSPIVVVGQRLKLDDGEDQNAQGDGGSEPPPANTEPRVDAVSQHRLQVVVKTVRAVQPGHLGKEDGKEDGSRVESKHQGFCRSAQGFAAESSVGWHSFRLFCSNSTRKPIP